MDITKQKITEDITKQKMADGIDEIAEGLQNALIDDDSEIQQIFDENEVHKSWKCFILEDESIKNGLNRAVTFLNNYDGDYIPDRKKILRAFHRDFECPSNIKAVILGHDPIPDTGLATGLAFSFPNGMTKGDLSGGYRGRAVLKFNNAIRKALRDENEKSLCNEYLAKNGILLLNTALTIGSGDWRQSEHFGTWKDFTFSLLKKLLLKIKQERNEDLIILCWGTNAKDIGERLQEEFFENNIMMNCDHPTYSTGDSNNFKTEAPEQFKKILEKHPNIFKRQQ